LLGDRGDAGAKYIEALKNAQPDKDEQLWGRLMQFGANMAAGTSSNALTNIGAAAQQTVPGILEDTKARRQAQGEMAKAQYDVSNMEYGDQVKLLTLAQTDRNAFEKIAADKGMKADELKNQLLIATNNNKTQLQVANIAANASMASAGARESLSREERAIFERAESPNATPEDKARAAALEKYLGFKRPPPNNQPAIDNAQTRAIKEKIASLEESMIGATPAERKIFREQIRVEREKLATGGPTNPVVPPTSTVLPPGIPQGSVQVGTSGGKPVYKAPDGKQYIVQ